MEDTSEKNKTKDEKSDSVAAQTIFKIGKYDNESLKTNVESLRKKIQIVYNKTKLLKRKGNKENIHEFCKTKFVPPVCMPDTLQVDEKTKNIIRSIQKEVKEVKKENITLKRGSDENETEINELNGKIEYLENYVTASLNVLKQIQTEHRNAIGKFSTNKVQLENETTKWQNKFENVSKTLDETTTKLEEQKTKLSKYNIRNLNKRQKRLETKYLSTLEEKQELENQCQQKGETIQELQQTLDRKQTELDQNVDQINSSKEKILNLKSEKHKLQKRIFSLKINSSRSKCALIGKHEEDIAILRDQIKINNKKISELEQLNVLLESDEIITFENGKYINEIRECIMSLLTKKSAKIIIPVECVLYVEIDLVHAGKQYILQIQDHGHKDITCFI